MISRRSVLSLLGLAPVAVPAIAAAATSAPAPQHTFGQLRVFAGEAVLGPISSLPHDPLLAQAVLDRGAAGDVAAVKVVLNRLDVGPGSQEIAAPRDDAGIPEGPDDLAGTGYLPI